MAKPRIAITDPAFIYRSSVHTNLAATFARVRAEQKLAAEAAKASANEAERKLVQIRRK